MVGLKPELVVELIKSENKNYLWSERADKWLGSPPR